MDFQISVSPQALSHLHAIQLIISIGTLESRYCRQPSVEHWFDWPLQSGKLCQDPGVPQGFQLAPADVWARCPSWGSGLRAAVSSGFPMAGLTVPSSPLW